MLREYLESIDREISAKDPEVAAGLRVGAGEEDLDLLRRTFFDGEAIPEDLETLFRWHDGQTGYRSLSPLDNRMLMSIQKVVNTWRFLSDPDEDIQQPWQDSWIPILANGAGDHVVYVGSGELRGQLIEYWHDSEDREVEFPSLESWALEVLGSYESLK
jgi:cell wall assembly regulator SMI1